METLYPSLYQSNSDWFSQSTEWTREENKAFERALAIYGEHDPERWLKVAAMIPGKTVFDVIKQYRELEEDVSDIEAGRVPVPGYLSSSFSLELVDDDDRDFEAYRKRPLTAKGGDQGRKKGVPWTEDEHRRFLLGLLKHGKGDWRNISRNFVVSKTPTQVASHAQKYFIRQQLSGVKDKRRPSIHDITTVNLAETAASDGNNNNNNKPRLLVDQSNNNVLFSQQKPIGGGGGGVQKVPVVGWNHRSKDGSIMVFDSTKYGNLFVSSSPHEFASSPLAQNLYAGAHRGGAAAAACISTRNLVSQMPFT